MSVDSTVTSLRTFVGSVVCIDLVGYSKLSVDRQIEVKKRFNARLMKVLAPVPAKDRVLLDTGDGVLIGFLADPAQSFAITLKIRQAIEAGSARIGIHLGSVKLIPGLSGDVRLVGDTLNIAERIASLAEPGQIVVSRAFHSMVSRLSDQHAALFRPAEMRVDKQGQEHEVFAVDPPPPRALGRPAIIGIAATLVIAIGATAAWLVMRRSSAPQAEPPAIARKGESTALAQPSPPPVETPKAAPAPAPAPVETKKAPPPRTETHPSSETRQTPQSQSTTSTLLSGGQKLLSTLGTGTADAARSAGSTASHLLSTVKEKTLGVSSPPSPPPTVVSRASTYFPQDAASQGIRYGKVRARLDIDASGDVTSVTILSADPPGYFEREAARSLQRWRFNAGASGRSYETDVEFKR
jgi:protein TonB